MAGGKFWSGNTKAAKLTPSIVLRMREEYGKGATQGDLCRRYGVSITQVGRIVRNEVWQDVQPEITDFDIEASARRMAALSESHTARMAEDAARIKDAETRGDKLLDELTGEQSGKD